MKKIQDIENQTLAKFLKKMFEYSSFDIQNVDFDGDKWFSKYAYTREQEREFGKYLLEHINEFSELFNRKLTRKDDKEKAINELLFMWGLRVIIDED